LPSFRRFRFAARFFISHARLLALQAIESLLSAHPMCPADAFETELKVIRMTVKELRGELAIALQPASLP
jgi:hypothetical protein